jgi:hypothetical protein
MATKHQKFEVDLPGYTPEEREAIALEIIDRVVKRSKSGKDKDGNAFPKYTPGYENSLNFKIGGKSSKVDLTLSGDMLGAIEVLKVAKKVQIGFQNGTTENAKADGNIRGTYGQSSPIKGGKYARDFLGITPAELDAILRRYPKGTETAANRAAKKLAIEERARQVAEEEDL